MTRITTIVTDLPSDVQDELLPMPVEEFLVPDTLLRFLARECLSAHSIEDRARTCRVAQAHGYTGREFFDAMEAERRNVAAAKARVA